jgi:hypothetical protein
MSAFVLFQVLTLALSSTAFFQGARPARAIRYYHGLEVQISPEKRAFRQNETLRLRVEFHNAASSSIRIGREVRTDSGFPFRLAIKIEDSQGHTILEPLQEPVEVPCMNLRESDVHKPKIWVELAPDSSYSQILTVYSRALAKAPPGSYRITGHYRSVGAFKGGHCLGQSNILESKTDDSTGLEWKGDVDTNVVWITTLAPGEQPGPF